MAIGILGHRRHALGILEDRSVDGVSTPFGDQIIERGTIGEVEVIWIRAFGWEVDRPSHETNQRAQMMAFKSSHVERVVTLNGFGGVNPEMSKEDLVVSHDYIKLDPVDHPSILPGTGWPRVDPGEALGGPFCPELREVLVDAATTASDRKVWDRAVNTHVKGPHLETAAEVRRARMIGGDLLSTALYPRVIYARELGICFGSLAWISDMAGMESAHEWFMVPTEELHAILERALQQIPEQAQCKCQSHYQVEAGRSISSFWGA